jgi:RNA polymerase sigma-70 factor (ECF subfamily)
VTTDNQSNNEGLTAESPARTIAHPRRESLLPDPVVTTTSSSAAAFEALLAGVVDAAFGTALRLTRNPGQAEELVQDAGILAFAGFAGLVPGTNFKTWYFRILVNCHRARQGPRPREAATFDWDDTPDLYLFARSIEHGLPYDGPDPADQLFERLGAWRVGEAVERLPEEYRLVVTLDFMASFSHEDIAAILEVPVGTVRARLYRGRKMLQKSLWRVAVEAGIAPGGGQ